MFQIIDHLNKLNLDPPPLDFDLDLYLDLLIDFYPLDEDFDPKYLFPVNYSTKPKVEITAIPIEIPKFI